MWLLLSARLRQWLLVTVVLPLVGRAAGGVATRIERSRGPNTVSTTLRRLPGAAPARARRGITRWRRHG